MFQTLPMSEIATPLLKNCMQDYYSVIQLFANRRVSNYTQFRRIARLYISQHLLGYEIAIVQKVDYITVH